MSFFERAEPAGDGGEPEYIEYRPPVWRNAPETIVPGAVGLRVILARTPDAAVWLEGFGACSDGLEFTLTAMRREAPDNPRNPHWHISDSLRFGVAFSDGRKVGHDGGPSTTLSGDPSTEISLTSPGGTGGNRSESRRHWLWPIPPEGPLTFAVEWEAMGIEETLVEVDAALFRAAAEQAVELWEDPRPPLPTDPEKLKALGWQAYAC